MKVYFNKNFWEELIAYFPWYDTGHIENGASNNSSIVACVFVTAVTFLPSRCLATIEGFLPSLWLTTMSGIHTHRQQCDLISPLYFFQNRAKNEKKPICIEIFIHSLKYINMFLILYTKCDRKFLYCRAYGDYMRRSLDWQLDLLGSTQLHNLWLLLTVNFKTHTHTDLLSSGVCSLVVTSQLSLYSSVPRTSCRPTHCLRIPSSLSHGNSAASAGSVYSLSGTYSLAAEPRP
jgi:hypothetical protein